MTQKVVIVSGTPLWAKILGAFAFVALIQVSIAVAIVLALAVAFYKAAPGLCQMLIAGGVIYVVATKFPILGVIVGGLAIVLFGLKAIGSRSSGN